MINSVLPDLVISNRCNQRFDYVGLDSLAFCRNKKHFLNYNYEISYVFNSRGFRDHDWPDSIDELKQAVWCIGDSCTVGIGQPWQHTWTQVLSTKVQQRIINVSLEGASNDWISRRAKDIMTRIGPSHMIVMWSHIERREASKDQWWKITYNNIRGSNWPECNTISEIELLPSHIKLEIVNKHNVALPFNPTGIGDEKLISQDLKLNDDDNFTNWKKCVDNVAEYNNIIHTAVPNFSGIEPKLRFWTYLQQVTSKHSKPVKAIDIARDGFHFDILTSKNLVDDIIKLL